MSFDQPSSSESAGPRVGQFSLLTLLLLTTTIGVLLPLVLLPGQCQQVRVEISTLWPLESVARQRPWHQISVARQNVTGSQGFGWQVYIPNGEEFQLAWTTNRPAPSPEATIATAAAPLPPGEHTLVIRYQQQANETWLIETLVDDQLFCRINNQHPGTRSLAPMRPRARP